MKIEVIVKFREAYRPTPRSRKDRFREGKQPGIVEVKEVPASVAPIACVVREQIYPTYQDVEYRFYDGKFWTPSMEKYRRGDEVVVEPLASSDLPHRIRGKYDFWNDGYDENLREFRRSASGYLLIAGKVYEEIGEPRYVVITFGLGHNHGGTGLFVDNYYNGNIPNTNYFRATDGDKAVAYADKLAAERGDTKYIGIHKKNIEVLRPEFFTLDPMKEHGPGDPFEQQLNNLAKSAGSSQEAAAIIVASIVRGKI